jgi:hypothetical protein
MMNAVIGSLGVDDFVAVRLIAITPLIPKQLEPVIFNSLQQIDLPALGAEGRGFESLRPDHLRWG